MSGSSSSFPSHIMDIHFVCRVTFVTHLSLTLITHLSNPSRGPCQYIQKRIKQLKPQRVREAGMKGSNPGIFGNPAGQQGIEVRLQIVPPSILLGFPGGSAGKESARNVADLGSIPGSGRSPGEKKGYPLQYSGLENSMDSIEHEVAKSRRRLSKFHFQFQSEWMLNFSSNLSSLSICVLSLVV